MRHTVIDKRYRILKKCGAGTTGTVFKTRDLKNNRIIALKILYRQSTSTEAVQRFKREFRLLTGLHHPNLCSVYDFGTLKDGRNYFTMEYVEGPNILEFTKNLPYPVRKNISNGVYPLIVQLCRALEYIHSKGLIHYDIKPGNVLIHKTGGNGNGAVVKLMDFGLAGEQRLKGGELIRGTFPYIAPEIIKGLAVDHRADLYSLGVLLYEIFTKRSLKVKDETSFATLLQQQQERVSEPLSWIVDGIPKRLERLIVRLLSFEPAARFSRANEIIREMNKLSRSKFALETAKTIEGYLMSSRFVGRKKEMKLLTSLYEKARKGEGKVVLITGDAGIGKSRLLKEFKIVTQLKHIHSFIGYAHRDKTGPLEPFYDVFKELINYLKDGFDLSRTKKFRLPLAVLFKMFPDLTDGHLRKNLPKLVPLEPKQEKLRNFEALSELIGYCTSSLGKLVILLEDLHWADDLSIQFLEYLGRNLAGRNILICGACRKEELKGNVVFKSMINNLKDEGNFTQVELEPLIFKSLYSFLDSTITPDSNSTELVRYLMKRTGGNPFFAEEILRTLLQKGGVSIGERVGIEDFKHISVPRTIEDIVLKRIKDLDINSQKIVTFAAVLLKDFNYGLMQRLSGLGDTELSRVLWELRRKQILVEEGNRYRLYHATLGEAINKRMAYREKRKLYYQSGKTLEFIYKGNKEGVIEDLAHYFINARNRKKGIAYGLRAAKKSKERYANNQAIQFYKGVLSLLDGKDPKRRFDILQELAKIESLVGKQDDAIKTYSKSINMRVGTIDKKINAYFAIGKIYMSKGKYNNALQVYQRIKKLLKKMKPGKFKTLIETHVNVRICSAHQRREDYKSVDKFTFKAVKLSQKCLKGKETVGLLASIYNTMGNVEYQKVSYDKADYDKAISCFKKAYKYFKMIKAESGVAAVPTNLGLCYYMKFDFKKSIDYYQKSIRISEKTGNQYSLSINLFNLGLVFEDIGCYLKALDCSQKALSISKKIGNQLITGASLGQQGWCLLRLCDYERSKESFEKSIQIFDKMGLKERGYFQMIGVGEIYQTTGSFTLALRFYRKALKIFRTMGNKLFITKLLVSISSVFIEIGEFSKAQRYIDDVLRIVTDIIAQDREMECYIALCKIHILKKDFVVARDYYEKGVRNAKEFGMKWSLLRLFLLISEINYHEKKYLKGFRIANKAKKLAKEMDAKDLYVEALLMKVKNGVEQRILSKIEATKILDEAKEIAEEIGCPEVLWKVYFTYGRFLQRNRDNLKALEFYSKCIEIFKHVRSKIKNKSYRKSYINRIDRQAVVAAINEI